MILKNNLKLNNVKINYKIIFKLAIKDNMKIG